MELLHIIFCAVSDQSHGLHPTNNLLKLSTLLDSLIKNSTCPSTLRPPLVGSSNPCNLLRMRCNVRSAALRPAPPISLWKLSWFAFSVFSPILALLFFFPFSLDFSFSRWIWISLSSLSLCPWSCLSLACKGDKSHLYKGSWITTSRIVNSYI